MNALDERWLAVRDRWPVRVKNTFGQKIPPFSLVLNTTPNSPAAVHNEIVLSVTQPNNGSSTDFHRGQYLVTGPFEIGAASDSEGLAATLEQPHYLTCSATPQRGQVWGPRNGSFQASQHYYGYEILGDVRTFNGLTIALARWIGIPYVHGKIDTTGTINKGGTCTVSVWQGNWGDDTSMNITGVVNSAVLLNNVNGKKCGVSFASGTPELIWVEC
jgi:hypothetical protein